jgi:hypothetical protein
MPFTEDEVTAIMKRLRKGEVVEHATCASRYIMTWKYEHGQWVFTDWQEGETFGGTVSDAEMRASIAAAPDEAFAHFVRRTT